jgi:hypothetical protein
MKKGRERRSKGKNRRYLWFTFELKKRNLRTKAIAQYRVLRPWAKSPARQKKKKNFEYFTNSINIHFRNTADFLF